MTSRLAGAIIRAGFVITVVVLPAALLVDVSTDTKQMVTLAALLLGIMTFAEYNAEFPSLIEFRDAAPFNRLRFAMIFSTVLALSLSYSVEILPPDFGAQAGALAAAVGSAMDFPFSPARLVTSLAQGQGDDPRLGALRNAAGLAYLISLSWLALFALVVRVGGWPSARKPLNIWVNLPMFDPTAGADVVTRLGRDGRINILLGFILPFIVPVLAKLFLGSEQMIEGTSQHSLIWIVSLWAFFPASLILRGIALLRIAELIVQTRAAHGAQQAKSFAPA